MEFEVLNSFFITTGGGAIVYLLTSFFKTVEWSDRMKIILLLLISLVVALVWYLIGFYPTYWVAVKGILVSALVVFTILVKFLGISWKQDDK